jgi:hypothetical protein
VPPCNKSTSPGNRLPQSNQGNQLCIHKGLATTHTTIYNNIFLWRHWPPIPLHWWHLHLHHQRQHIRISPSERNIGNMFFGILENRSTLPMKRLTTALCVRIPNMRLTIAHIYNLHWPPKIMKVLHNNVALQRDILTRAKRAHGPTTIPGTYNYCIFGYIGSCQYCFEFSTDSTTNNDAMTGLLLLHRGNTMRCWPSSGRHLAPDYDLPRGRTE